MRSPNRHSLNLPGPPALALIAASGLAAMASGHALELWLERHGVLGDARAAYAHPLQALALEAAAALFLGVLALVIGRLTRQALHSERRDGLLPALDGICALGVARTSLALVAVQIGSLIAVELCEQRWSHYGGGIAAIVGPQHATAVAVHVVVGLLFAFALHRLARFVRAQSHEIVVTLAVFLRRLAQPRRLATPGVMPAIAAFTGSRKPALLALGIANRPPPRTSPATA